MIFGELLLHGLTKSTKRRIGFIAGLIAMTCLAATMLACKKMTASSRAKNAAISEGVITVDSRGDLQSALDQAKPGDVIMLEPGATYSGNFVLPDKGGSENQWITIRSAASNDKLPPADTRITPANADQLPKIVSSNSAAAISASHGAHNYMFVGIEFGLTPDAPANYGLVRLGEGNEAEASLLPHDITIDRCYIHGSPTQTVRRGVALNSASTSVINSYISDIHEVGADTQALCGWNGPGPFTIVNNYLEASGENIMFGGADPKIYGLVPSDIEIKRNHCFKPLTWKKDDPSFAGIGWSVKNLLELKNARRVVIEGNVFENDWIDAQTGYAILFKCQNQDGTAPWSVTQDVQFINNVVRGTSSAMNVLGRDPYNPSGQMTNIVIRNNLFEDVGGGMWDGEGTFMKITDAVDVTVDHNTVMQRGNIITAYGNSSTDFMFTNNITLHNSYGIKGDGTQSGNPTLEKYFPSAVFKRNIVVMTGNYDYPRNKNYYPTSLADIGFADQAKGNYRLNAASPYKHGGTKEQDVGADVDAIERATAGVTN